MFSDLPLNDIDPRAASVVFALALGLAFGVLAERTAFCLRRAVVGADRRQAAGIWLMALAVAVAGTQGAVHVGLIDFTDHRLSTTDLPLLAIVIGGLAFGAGMVLTRGCISRLTVLSMGGNLRALGVLILAAIAAHAAMKGVPAPTVAALASARVELASGTLAGLPGGGVFWAGLIVVIALAYALRSGNGAGKLAMAAALGALVPLGWVGTGFVLFDDFDPIAMESLSFIGPITETLFWTLASTAIAPGFGVGLLGGVLVGAFLSAVLGRRFRWQSFDAPAQTGRYAAGAVLMGTGGVLAGGCTLGAGLAGVPTLGIAAFIGLAAMILGAAMTARVLGEGPATGPLPVPAE